VNTIDLTYIDYLLLALLVLLSVITLLWLRLGVVKSLLSGMVRMIIQLSLVGLYLKVIFDINSWLLSGLWILVMLIVANYSLLGRAGLKRSSFFLLTGFGTAVGSLLVVIYFVLVVIQPEPLYDARYLIPVFGMVLGNCMRGNVLSLERFYSGILEEENTFITWQMLGASVREAYQPFLKKALVTSLGPQISTIGTMGIVSLPGMMTGQILGGAFPVTAIKYQIAIMICIFSAQLFSSVINIFLTSRVSFSNSGMLKKELFLARN
jgi:putative ABC transport system permease protein